jgi:hypothetical protein
MLRKSFFAFWFFLFSVGSAKADAVSINSGALRFSTIGTISIVLSGNGFDVIATANEPSLPCGGLCIAGTPVNFSRSMFFGPTDFSQGTVFASGNLYTISRFLSPPPQPPHVNVTLDVTFVSPIITVPTTGEEFMTLTAPFTATGELRGDNVVQTPAFSVQFVGAGLVTLDLRRNPNQTIPGGYIVQNFRYGFQPIPEPTTLVLLATGIGILAYKLKRFSK